MSHQLKTLTAVAGLVIGIAFVSPTHATGLDMGGGMMNGGMMNEIRGAMMGMMGGGGMMSGGGMMDGRQSAQMGGCGSMMQGRHQVPNSQFPRRSLSPGNSQPPRN